MAHAKTSDPRSKIIREMNRGFRSRRIMKVPLVLADARTDMAGANHELADAIQDETIKKAIMIAPCRGEILRFTANALIFPTAATTATVKLVKAVIGAADVDMCTAIDINNPADETAIDAVLSTVANAVDLIEGQLLFVELATTGNVTVKSDAMAAELEWLPTEK